MGIGRDPANAIIGAHKHRPIAGDVLLCGRQSVYFTAEEAAALFCEQGLTPCISLEECELDRETRLGGEGQRQREGQAISDRAFFRMLGVERLTILDHSDYEGAKLIVDLNYAVAEEFDGRFDVIIDGGTLDNVWNPSQAIMNVARMLRPGGRLLTYNMFSNHYNPYSMLPHQWYLDYFAANDFAYAQVYFCSYQFSGTRAIYRANLRKLAAVRSQPSNFPIVEATSGVGSFAYAVKGERSTWDRAPSQDIYRSDDEWSVAQAAFKRFAEDPSPPLMYSTGTTPIAMPGGDDFEYIDASGHPITEQNRERHDSQILDNFLRSILYMNETRGDQPWGIIETDRMFYRLINEHEEAADIAAKSNVTLFDARMLNESIDFAGGISKEIFPAAAALLMEFPMLVLSCEPEMDAMWIRLSKYFRNCKLYAASHFDKHLSAIPCFFDTGIVLSTSFEHGEYMGSRSSIQRTAAWLSARDADEPFGAAESLLGADVDHSKNSFFGRPDSTEPQILFQDCSLSVQAACDRAAELSAAGNRQDAISLWSSIRDGHPDHAEAAYQLGQLILEQARETADALYADARRLAPEHPAYAAATAADHQGAGILVALKAKLRGVTS